MDGSLSSRGAPSGRRRDRDAQPFDKAGKHFKSGRGEKEFDQFRVGERGLQEPRHALRDRNSWERTPEGAMRIAPLTADEPLEI